MRDWCRAWGAPAEGTFGAMVGGGCAAGVGWGASPSSPTPGLYHLGENVFTHDLPWMGDVSPAQPPVSFCWTEHPTSLGELTPLQCQAMDSRGTDFRPRPQHEHVTQAWPIRIGSGMNA